MAALSLGIRILNMAIFSIFWLNFSSAQCLDKNGNFLYSESLYQPEHISWKSRLKIALLSIAFGSLTGIISASFFVFLVGKFFRYINKKSVHKSPFVFSPNISPETLTLALSNEPQLLGSSSIGKYYKAILDNGLTVAVKSLEPFEHQLSGAQPQGLAMKRKIKQELENLTGLRHRNLMSLRAYACEPCGCYLVYDYVPKGSLDDVMRRVREQNLELKWELRLRIAVGIAKGLHYLHFICDPRKLHYNLKPCNIILDSEFEPRLADWGLAAIFPNFPRGSTVYLAPECLQDYRYTDKSDVFSFGVILGTLLTGRDPFDPSFGESGSGASLGQWLRRRQQAGESHGALDRSILGDEMEENEMMMALRICIACLSHLPGDRPSSDELVSMLTQLNSF